MWPFKKKTGYISDIDKFLVEFDMTHSPSASQRAEIKKYARIAQLIRNPNQSKK